MNNSSDGNSSTPSPFLLLKEDDRNDSSKRTPSPRLRSSLGPSLSDSSKHVRSVHTSPKTTPGSSKSSSYASLPDGFDASIEERGSAFRTFADRDDMFELAGQNTYRLGVCVMENKRKSAPFQRVIESAVTCATADGWTIDVIEFEDDTILNKPIESWPTCDCLIAFSSAGFPLQKAIAYSEMYPGMYLINDLKSQIILQDRLQTYIKMRELGVPLARFAVVKRSSPEGPASPEVRQVGDYLYIGDKRLVKPFVEKPLDAENHDVWIYFPQAQGGGVRKLFRKENDESSAMDSTRPIRTDGSYIYEEFLITERLDCKVYSVGPNWALCQQRKSPTSDGMVERTTQGFERRADSHLTSHEMEIVRKIYRGFRQTVCGFDLLRGPSASYVCDINGWSRVKNHPTYWRKCGEILHQICQTYVHRQSFDSLRTPVFSETPNFGSAPSSPPGLNVSSSFLPPSTNLSAEIFDRKTERDTDNTLLGVDAVLRHADRTPKQKLKVKDSAPELLAYFEGKLPGSLVKLKNTSPANCRKMLKFSETVSLIIPKRDPDDPAVKKLSTIQDVLAANYSGSKLQIKPDPVNSFPVTRVLIILKWGGMLTQAGMDQAHKLGSRFLSTVVPDLPPSLRAQWARRLVGHVYSNDERRVHLTAQSVCCFLLLFFYFFIFF